MKVPLTVVFQVACPHCERDYLLELDVVKLARLKRVAVCGQCGSQFSVSVRTQKGPTGPSLAPRAAAEEPKPPLEGAAAAERAREQARRHALGQLQTEPLVRSPRVAEGEVASGAKRRPDLESMTTEPDFPFSAETPRDRSRRSDTRPDAKVPRGPSAPEGHPDSPSAPAVGPVDTHIIVEVGTMDTGDAKAKKHMKTYRAQNLVTRPGLGVPFKLRAAAAGEAVSRAEDEG